MHMHARTATSQLPTLTWSPVIMQGTFQQKDVGDTIQHKDRAKLWSCDGFNCPEKRPVWDIKVLKKCSTICAIFIKTTLCTKSPMQKPVHA